MTLWYKKFQIHPQKSIKEKDIRLGMNWVLLFTNALTFLSVPFLIGSTYNSSEGPFYTPMQYVCRYVCTTTIRRARFWQKKISFLSTYYRVCANFTLYGPPSFNLQEWYVVCYYHECKALVGFGRRPLYYYISWKHSAVLLIVFHTETKIILFLQNLEAEGNTFGKNRDKLFPSLKKYVGTSYFCGW